MVTAPTEERFCELHSQRAPLVTERPGLRQHLRWIARLPCDLCAAQPAAHASSIVRLVSGRRRTTLTRISTGRWTLTAATASAARVRLELLLDSRDEPWSAAERRLHQLLRAAGILGWKANQPVLVEGANYYPDARFFGRTRLLIEIDGREFHSEPDVFESDRWRQNLLILDGWCILRFTRQMLVERPDEVVATIRRAMAMLLSAA